jgi:hypothetical protein
MVNFVSYGGFVPHAGRDEGKGFRFSEFGLFFDIGTNLVLDSGNSDWR